VWSKYSQIPTFFKKLKENPFNFKKLFPIYACHQNLNLAAVHHRKGKSKNVMPQNSILLIYRILEVIAGLIFDNI